MTNKDREGFESLDAWQKSRDFANAIYREVIPQLPVEEKFNLADQLRRASVSVPANIAEGYGRFYYQSNVQFCYFARGSAEEVISHLILAHDQGFISDSKFFNLRDKGTALVQLINGYISYLKRAKQGENEPGSPRYLKDESSYYLDEIDVKRVTNNG